MFRYIALIISTFSLSSYAWGFNVSPISAEIDVTKQRSHLLTVTSQDKEAVPIKIKAVSWRLTSEGQDIREDTSDIILFPGQFVLRPDERRVVRVAARTKTKPDIEQTYRILIQQVPVELKAREGTASGVRLLTSYATAFYVSPKNPRSEVHLTAVDRASSGLVFKLVNNGNAHTHLYQLILTFSQDGHTVSFDKDKHMPHFYNENLLARSERDFAWKWPADIARAVDLKRPFDVEVKFSCESCGGTNAALTYSVP
jgi:fimbrial chaperone protein